jgi:hypothetical protein
VTETTLVPTTERVVGLTRQYFESVGATVRQDGAELTIEFDGVAPPEWVGGYCDRSRLVATVADRAESETPTADSETAESETPTADSETTESETPTIGPETPFTRRLIDAAATHHPVGTASVTGVPGGAETLVPAWLRASPARVASVEFYPYYDGRVVCAWLRAAVETPSQYQRESLHAVVVDPETGNRIDCDPTALLDAAESDAGAGAVASESDIERALVEARSHVVTELDETIKHAEDSAGRAAAAAFEEYAERQRARLSERRAERDEIEQRLATIGDRLADATGDDRVELLEERAKLTDRRTELDEAVSRIETADADGFPAERERLQRRHSVAVRTRPVAVTTVAVERGDLALELVGDDGRATLDLSVGAVTGPRRTPSCPDCGSEYGPQNELRVTTAGLACADCRNG